MVIPVLRPFQAIAAFDMIFSDKEKILLVRKTGEGKTCIILTTDLVHLGFTSVIVSLVGIGVD